MANTDRVDWLLVGPGDIATKRVAPALTEAASSRLAAVCDAVPERAAELARAYGVEEVYADLDEALARTSANAVYFATPVFLHSQQAACALAAGKHVLVEKPLGVSAEDAGQAVAAAQGTELRAGCAYFRRCSPRYEHAQQMLAQGEFGRIVLVRMTFFSWANPDVNDPKYWRVVPEKSGGGPLADMGSHMFDAFIGLLGMPTSVYAKVSTKVQPYEVEDSAVIIMEMADGADVIASFNWNSKTWSHEFEIIGTEAKLKWHPYDGGTVLKTVGRDIFELDLPNAANVHLPLVWDFVNAVLEGRPPAVPLAEALKANILIDAVYESGRSGEEVAL